MKTRLVLLVCVALSLVCSTSAAERPNVVLIVGDDQAWTDFGFMGHKVIRTPHLDRLAAESAVFTHGYVPTSLCRPSLASILTGRYPHQHKICCNDPPEGVAREAMWPFIKNLPTIPRVLQTQGYRSFQTGKLWDGHFANAGFTHGMTVKGRHGDDGLVIGRKTMQPIYDFIDASGKTPFFLWYAPMLPHQPHDPPERLLRKYAVEGRDIRLAKYWAMCEFFDETCGDLLDYLDKKGLRDNTLVAFVVDNGWIQSTGPAQPGEQFLTRSKKTPYDAGLRTPVLLRWPGKIKPARHAELVSSLDLAPTFFAACGFAAPQDLPGVNLLDTAAGKGPLNRSAVYGEIHVHTAVNIDDPTTSLTHRWVRAGDWKLIVPVKKDEPVELYDVARDPAETKNLASGNAEQVARLKKLLDDWWQG